MKSERRNLIFIFYRWTVAVASGKSSLIGWSMSLSQFMKYWKTNVEENQFKVLRIFVQTSLPRQLLNFLLLKSLTSSREKKKQNWSRTIVCGWRLTVTEHVTCLNKTCHFEEKHINFVAFSQYLWRNQRVSAVINFH